LQLIFLFYFYFDFLTFKILNQVFLFLIFKRLHYIKITDVVSLNSLLSFWFGVLSFFSFKGNWLIKWKNCLEEKENREDSNSTIVPFVFVMVYYSTKVILMWPFFRCQNWNWAKISIKISKIEELKYSFFKMKGQNHKRKD
jgi:hypothetical protein